MNTIDSKVPSGVYIRIGKKDLDLIHDTTNRQFYNWLKNQGVEIGYQKELSVKDKYDFVKAIEQVGIRIAKIQSEWSAFEKKVLMACNALNN